LKSIAIQRNAQRVLARLYKQSLLPLIPVLKVPFYLHTLYGQRIALPASGWAQMTLTQYLSKLSRVVRLYYAFVHCVFAGNPLYL
jgi:hypothetical protein